MLIQGLLTGTLYVAAMAAVNPALLIVGVEGMDEEQLELASSSAFWRLMQERRAQKTVSRAELEARLASATATS